MVRFNFRSGVNRNLGDSLEISTMDYPSLNSKKVLYQNNRDEFGRKALLRGATDRASRRPIVSDDFLRPSDLSYHALVLTQTFMSSEFFPKVYLFGKMAMEYNLVFKLDAEMTNVISAMRMVTELSADYLISEKKICNLLCGGMSLYGYVYGVKLSIAENVESHVDLSVLFLGLTEGLL